ncbi:MAG: deoxyguanosinetriphosphate triphosphohydrolase [Salinivirgaceae bacterium]|nr:deoxyguanosinetriphosphate triphosphohydrolase [Salinivirgaceae bacterium]
MHWEKLLSADRFGKETMKPVASEFARTEFQRDFDRLIFSSPFRRLQNKTQVFPLPGSVFVHNRLTHSLEVASVGRSLGNLVSQKLIEKGEKSLLISEIGSIVAAACLSHDLGNPPFGHAGEKAISDYFLKGEGAKYQATISENEWQDLLNFEGNANALRLLTHTFNGRRYGGFVLTYATLASLIKYPYSSINRTKKNKYGYFKSEEETFQKIAKKTELVQIDSVYARHPLVYLVEAADDISYQIMDIEDAHKLNILSTDRTVFLLTSFFDEKEDSWFYEKKAKVFAEVTDKNEQIAFLRASLINLLVNKTSAIFTKNEAKILEGKFTGSLVDYLEGASATALRNCKDTAFKEIYNHRSVIEIEITGYNVLNTLLSEYIRAFFDPKAEYSKKLLTLLPLQYQEQHSNNYEKLRSVIDFISGMTDLYALDLYKLIKGIGI